MLFLLCLSIAIGPVVAQGNSPANVFIDLYRSKDYFALKAEIQKYKTMNLDWRYNDGSQDITNNDRVALNMYRFLRVLEQAHDYDMMKYLFGHSTFGSFAVVQPDSDSWFTFYRDPVEMKDLQLMKFFHETLQLPFDTGRLWVTGDSDLTICMKSNYQEGVDYLLTTGYDLLARTGNRGYGEAYFLYGTYLTDAIEANDSDNASRFLQNQPKLALVPKISFSSGKFAFSFPLDIAKQSNMTTIVTQLENAFAPSKETFSPTPGNMQAARFYEDVINSDGVRLRDKPSTTGRVVTNLTRHQKVYVLENEGSESIDDEDYDWIWVATNTGVQGYVYGKYLWTINPRDH